MNAKIRKILATRKRRIEERLDKPRRDYDRAADLAMLWFKQHTDGGWSTRDVSDTRNWSAQTSDIVIQLIEGLPDAAKPESDPYMTALAIRLLHESGTPARDTRLRRGIAWLKREQRVSGRWWMHSLYRGNSNFAVVFGPSPTLSPPRFAARRVRADKYRRFLSRDADTPATRRRRSMRFT